MELSQCPLIERPRSWKSWGFEFRRVHLSKNGENGKVEDGTLTVSDHQTTAELAKSRIELSHPPLIERQILGKVEDRNLKQSTYQKIEKMAKLRNELLYCPLIERPRSWKSWDQNIASSTYRKIDSWQSWGSNYRSVHSLYHQEVGKVEIKISHPPLI